MAKGKVTHVIKIEILGRLRVWSMRSEPFSGTARGDKAKRKAYELGFVQRTQDVHNGTDERTTGPHFKTDVEARAWEQGYREAQAQDAAHL